MGTKNQKKSFTGIFALLLLGLFFSTLQSCDKKEEVRCGCGGSILKNISNEQAIIVDTWDGFHLLSLKNGYLLQCNEIPSNLKVDGKMILITGKINLPCSKTSGSINDLQDYPFDLISYSSPVDSLFRTEELNISLFNSVQPSKTGYGYEIKTPNIKIRQDIIPGISGLKPFATKTEAFKLAVLIGYKIQLGQGLPSATLVDLYRLKINLE